MIDTGYIAHFNRKRFKMELEKDGTRDRTIITFYKAARISIGCKFVDAEKEMSLAKECFSIHGLDKR